MSLPHHTAYTLSIVTYSLADYGDNDPKRYRQEPQGGPPHPAPQHPQNPQHPNQPGPHAPKDRIFSVVANYYKVELEGNPPVYQYHLEFMVICAV